VDLPHLPSCALVAVLVCVSHCPAQPGPQVDTIGLDTRFQTIENFGASDCWSMQKIGAWSEESKSRVADLLFSMDKGIGLSCWRFNLGAGIDHVAITNPWRTAETFEVGEGQYDWSRQANERWFLRAAKARGVPRFLAFACSPPARLTRTGYPHCGPETGTTNLKPGAEGQFARYLADILKHFADNPDESERITFDTISPVNEPQWAWDGNSQEGCRASNDDLRALIVALHAELRRQGLDTEIITPESGSLPDMWSRNGGASQRWGATYGDYIDELCGNAQVSELLARRIAYHSYWSDDPGGQLLQNRERLCEAMGRYPDWRLWQTEYCIMRHKRDLTMATALEALRVVHLDLTVANVSAWQWWLAVSNCDYKDGLIYTDYAYPGDPETIYPSKLLWGLGNYSRFVRPGMVRVALSRDNSDLEGLLGSAYADPAKGRVVVVYVNMAEETVSIKLQATRDGSPAPLGQLTPYVTSDREGDDLRQYPPSPEGEAFRIPARSVVTLVARMGE